MDYKYLSYYVYTVIADETEHTDNIDKLYTFLKSNFSLVAPNTFKNYQKITMNLYLKILRVNTKLSLILMV